MSCDTTINRLFPLLLAGDRTGARGLVHERLEAGVSVESLVRDVFCPVLRTINALHGSGRLSELAHYYSRRLLHILAEDVRRLHRDGRGEDERPFASGISPLARGMSLHSPFLTLRLIDDTLLVRPSGPSIGEREAQIIAGEVIDGLRSLGSRVRRVELDLADVSIMTSIGLSMCTDIHHAARTVGAACSARNLSPRIRELFRLARTDRTYRVLRTRQRDRAERAVAA